MCGIVGLFNCSKKIDKTIIERSLLVMKHRGPDASGIYIGQGEHIALGNNRLAFVDPQKRSDQPLIVGDCVITFNGEIYNYRELKKILQKSGYVFSTGSDTEVIVHAIAEWGTDAFLKFNGCFSIILYNKKTSKLIIARDRLGEKQLVYTRAKNGDVMFASEVKGLLVHPAISSTPNFDRYIGELIFNLYADQSETFFKNIFHFPPGHFCELDLNGKDELTFKKYWDVSDINLRGYTSYDIAHLTKELVNTLTDSVTIQMPEVYSIGSILSGGLDSSLITTLAVSLHQSEALPCFTVGYEKSANRDLRNARILAHFKPNLDLNEIIVEQSGITANEEAVFSVLEEPVIDTILPSMFENYKRAKSLGLKCVLNGQGSDELWLGYLNVDPIYKLSKKTYTKSEFARYWYDSSYFTDEIKNASIKRRIMQIIEKNLEKNFYAYSLNNHYDTLTRFAMKTHLVQLLRHEDRLSMANSIEIRLPFLDTRLVDFGLSIPSSLKMYDGREKYLLRKVAKNILPGAIIKRKKQGFPLAPSSYDISRNIRMRHATKDILHTSSFLRILYGDLPEKLFQLPFREQQIPLSLSLFERSQYKYKSNIIHAY